MSADFIVITAEVHATADKVWNYWTAPEHITQWCFANDDWHCPKAENDLRTGGVFSSTMAAKDGSMSFDFGGVYDEVVLHQRIAYTLGDGRKVEINFTETAGKTFIEEKFEPESQNPRDMQQAGWQAILNNFKQYVEGN